MTIFKFQVSRNSFSEGYLKIDLSEATLLRQFHNPCEHKKCSKNILVSFQSCLFTEIFTLYLIL